VAVEFKDYYATLGVAKSATDAEIKKAYRKLARKHHPDLNPGDKAAEAKFKEVNEANEVLGDPDKRRKYDELGANWRAYEHGAPGGGPGPFDQTGGGSNYRTVTPEEMQEMFGGDAGNPFSDFFQQFFGGGGGVEGGRPGYETTGGRRARASRPRRGRDIEQPVELTLEQAFSGTSKRIVVKSDGHARTIEVRIPAGVKADARVRAAGEGEPGPNSGSAGDLYLVVRLLPHARFERRGQDLYVRAPVPITTAVLGGEIGVPTLSGSTLRLKIPELTPPGRVFRLRGQGMPAVGKPDERGELYATVEIQIPTTLSSSQRKLFEELKKAEA
jgi:DnaJ-class molecular chaperone